MNLIEFCIASDYHNKSVNLEKENKKLENRIKRLLILRRQLQQENQQLREELKRYDKK